jgi:thiamine kinase-like enzyme
VAEPEAYSALLTPEQLVELERDLIEILRGQGMPIEEIKLIGLKGSGDFSSVFSVIINGVHHVLKVYRLEESFRREIRHLRRQIPKDRFFFVWSAKRNRFNFFITVIEVPDGHSLSERMLTPIVSERLGNVLVGLHSLQYAKRRVSISDVKNLLEEVRPWAVEHGGLFPSLGEARIDEVIGSAENYLDRHAKKFRVRRSRTHNDLWWANVIVAEEDVYLIDWENLGRDDYARDLAFFRIMAYYERSVSPVTMWDGEPDDTLLEAFMKPILDRYPQQFDDDFFWQRYGFYALHWSMMNFGRALWGDRRGVWAAGKIAQTGIRLFEDLCLATEQPPE